MARTNGSTRSRRTTEQIKHDKKVSLGAAIREARLQANMTQAEFGEALGDSPQTTVSRWEKGLVDLTAQQINDIEEALGLEAGQLMAEAGYCSVKFDKRNLEAALRSDPNLHPRLRPDVVRMYQSYVESSKTLRTTR